MRKALFAYALIPLALAGCGSRDFTLTDGVYSVTAAAGFAPADRTLVRAAKLTLYGAGQKITIEYDGQMIVNTFKLSPQAEWAEGCPTQTSSARMETATVETAELALGSLKIAKPTLVSACNLEPPSTALFILPAPVEKFQPGCTDESMTPCLGFTKLTR